MGKVKFICGSIQCLTIKSVPDKTNPDRPVKMRISHQSVSRVHICFLAVLAQKALFSIFMPIFYNMAAAAIWAAGFIGQLFIYGGHSKYKVNEQVQIGFTQIFDIVKKAIDLLIHMVISL